MKNRVEVTQPHFSLEEKLMRTYLPYNHVHVQRAYHLWFFEGEPVTGVRGKQTHALALVHGEENTADVAQAKDDLLNRSRAALNRGESWKKSHTAVKYYATRICLILLADFVSS